MKTLPHRFVSLLAALSFAACGSEAATRTNEQASAPTSAGSMEARPAEPSQEEPEPAVAEAEPQTEEATEEVATPSAPSTENWAAILAAYRKESGFDYAALAANDEDRAKLAGYVAAIGAVSNLDALGRDEKLAFYINAYNALTVSAVIERFPIESVMRVEGFFDAITHQVAGETMTLNTLENERIRGEEFSEPRIHFAVNCASASCPPLRAEVFAADSLEAALEEQAVNFVRSTTRVQGRRANLSKIFEWFADDFGGADGVRSFVASRLEGEDAETVGNARTRLRYDEYDWALNAAE